MCSDGINDMFEPSPWNFSAFSLDCQKRWGVTPRPDWAIIEYWGQSISTATNIIFRYILSKGNLLRPKINDTDMLPFNSSLHDCQLYT